MQQEVPTSSPSVPYRNAIKLHSTGRGGIMGLGGKDPTAGQLPLAIIRRNRVLCTGRERGVARRGREPGTRDSVTTRNGTLKGGREGSSMGNGYGGSEP